MNALRPALLLPLAAACLANAGIAQWPPLLGMVLLGLRAMGLLRLPRRRWILVLVALPFALQAALLPTEASFRNVVALYGIAAHLFFWIGLHQALTAGSERGAFPFALGSVAAAALQLPPGQLWLPLLALPLLVLALLPDGAAFRILPPRGMRRAWILVWTLAFAATLTVEFTWAKRHFHWTGWQNRGSSDVLLGFSTQTDLNRAPGFWRTRRQEQIVLRLYGKNCRDYLAGRVYSEYRRGVWSSREGQRLVEPSGKLVGLEVFGTPDEGGEWIWAESLIPLQGTLFAPFDPRAIASTAETLPVSREGFPSFAALSSPSPWRFQSRPEGLPYGQRLAELDLSSRPTPEDTALGAAIRPWVDSLARTLWDEGDDHETAVRKMAEWFASEFRYEWANPKPVEGDPIRGFAYEKKGYCEHFATLAVLLLRQRGIPTRYAKGWLPGERMGNGCAVRRIAAHSWTLVWNGESWIQRDFTPPAMLPKAKTGRVRLLREKLNAKIGEFKLFLFHGAWRLALEEGADRWKELLVPGEVLAFLLVLLLLVRRHRRLAALSEAQRLWAKAERLLRAEGIPVGKGETAGALLERLRGTKGTRRVSEAIALLERYDEIRWRR